MGEHGWSSGSRGMAAGGEAESSHPHGRFEAETGSGFCFKFPKPTPSDALPPQTVPPMGAQAFKYLGLLWTFLLETSIHVSISNGFVASPPSWLCGEANPSPKPDSLRQSQHCAAGLASVSFLSLFSAQPHSRVHFKLNLLLQ